MGKKSRAKAQRHTPQSVPKNSPALEQLLEDYFTTKRALAASTGIVFFRGKPVTDESFSAQFFEVGEALGIDRMELMMALTVKMNV